MTVFHDKVGWMAVWWWDKGKFRVFESCLESIRTFHTFCNVEVKRRMTPLSPRKYATTGFDKTFWNKDPLQRTGFCFCHRERKVLPYISVKPERVRGTKGGTVLLLRYLRKAEDAKGSKGQEKEVIYY